MPTTVYYTTLDDYREDFIALLPETERQRAKSIKHPQRRRLFVLGRALLAQALEAQRGCRGFEVSYQEHGKPLLTEPNHWHFNITHSGKHLFLALREHHSIGIDSEIIRPRPYQRLADKLFDDTTREIIANATNPELTFYQYWTRYEAHIKSLGLSVFSDLPAEDNCFFHSYRLDNLLVSLCSHSPFKAVSFFQWQGECVTERICAISPTIIKK